MIRRLHTLLAGALAGTLTVACTGEAAPEPVEDLPEDGEPGLYRLSLEHDGLTRTAVVVAPGSLDASAPAPLFLNFHGFGGTAEDHLLEADLRDLAERDGVLLAYPQGSLLDGDPHWNASPPGPDNKSEADDLGFTRKLVQAIGESYALDTERVYAAGYSNGGMFAFALACQESDLVAAVGSISGTMLDGTEEDCRPAHPTAVITLHGTEDGVLPYEGGAGHMGAEDIVAWWAAHNDTDTEPTTRSETDGGLTIEEERYAGGSGGAEVAHYRYVGGGHVWFEAGLGGDSASAMVWDFLTAFDVGGAR